MMFLGSLHDIFTSYYALQSVRPHFIRLQRILLFTFAETQYIPREIEIRDTFN